MRFYALLGLCWAMLVAPCVAFGARSNETSSTDIKIPRAPDSGILQQYRASIRVRGPEPYESAENALTWREAAAEALKNNPTLAAARFQISQQREQIK
ncbi:MAG: hypothetical protein ACREKE_03915, partial [bacterium]